MSTFLDMFVLFAEDVMFYCSQSALSVCQPEISQNYEQIFMTFDGQIGLGPRNNSLYFDFYLDLEFPLLK